MKVPAWSGVLVLAALLLTLITLYVLAARMDSIAEFPQRATLRSFIRLNAELNRDLLRLRTGLLHNYDSVNATVAAMYERLVILQRQTPASLRDDISALAEAIKNTEERVELFKSDIAVSRNSLMYLTFLADRRFERAAVGQDAMLNAMLARLDNSLVRYLYNPRAQTREPALAVLHDITAHHWTDELQAEVQALSVHGGMVLERVARVDETLNARHADPLGDQVRHIETVLGDYASAASERARMYEIAIFGVALLLVLYVAYAVRRLRNAAKEIASSEERFRATFEQAAVGIAHVGPDGRYLRINQKICDILGYTAEELLRCKFQDITHPEDVHASTDYVQQLLKGESTTFSTEKRYVRKNGSSIWINLTVALVRTPAGTPDYLVTIVEDISARKYVELEHGRLAALVEGSSEFIATATLDGRVTYINPAGCSMLGLDPALVTRKTLPDFVSPAFLAEVESTILPAALRDGFWSGESHLRHFLTGEDITVHQSLFTIQDLHSGAPALLANISHDIRDRKQAELAIRQLNAELERRVKARTAQLEESNRHLDAFAHSASHDLRTPLRAIDGFSQALLEDCGPALSLPGRGHLARIRAAAQRMGQLIDDLLQFSRVTRAEMVKGTVNLSRLAREVLSRWAQFQPARRIEIHIVDGLQAQGDGPLVAIVLENLLGNAWKYSAKNPHARIEFAAEQRANQTVFYVRDNGAGFDMKYAGKLFGVFQRLHRTEDFEGTGVGLATVANIINRHGGQVWADSAPNQGATFYFTLPSSNAT